MLMMLRTQAHRCAWTSNISLTNFVELRVVYKLRSCVMLLRLKQHATSIVDCSNAWLKNDSPGMQRCLWCNSSLRIWASHLHSKTSSYPFPPFSSFPSILLILLHSSLISPLVLLSFMYSYSFQGGSRQTRRASQSEFQLEEWVCSRD